jgi:hypothetical protein
MLLIPILISSSHFPSGLLQFSNLNPTGISLLTMCAICLAHLILSWQTEKYLFGHTYNEATLYKIFAILVLLSLSLFQTSSSATYSRSCRLDSSVIAKGFIPTKTTVKIAVYYD